MKRKIQIIHTDRKQDTAYVAAFSASGEADGCSNQTLSLSQLEEALGYKLPDNADGMYKDVYIENSFRFKLKC